MSNGSKIYFSIGCILATTAFAAMLVGCGKNQTSTPGSSAPAKTVSEAGTNAAVTAPPARPQTPLPDPYFKLAIESKTDIEQSTEREKIDNDAELKYAHQKTNDGIILTFYSMESKKGSGGVFIQDLLMTRDHLINIEGNDKTETSFDELPQKWQAGLAGTFATGLCKITLDTNQNEMGRQMLSPNRTGLVGDENLSMVRLMHGPWHPGAEQWQATNSIPTTYSFVIHCPVTYTRTADASNVVKMDGSFTNEAIDSPADGVTFKNVWCNFAGKETFDQAAGEYTSGAAAFEYKFQIYQEGTLVATIDRHVNLDLEQISAGGK